ncbi:MAG: hypothetical protein ACOZFS_02100 [Thermodesulfobacteriota bacterium]
MENPITALKAIVKDPVELTSITLPSAALVAILFTYKQQIHSTLKDLPDPLAGSAYGALIFIVVTLLVSMVLKQVSHDVLNLLYDKCYRDFKRKTADTWYKRAQDEGLLTGDPLLSNYNEALEYLRKNDNPVVLKVDLLQTQSKLARSISLMLFLFAVVMGVKSTFVLAVVCILLSAFMLYVFFKGRWSASELVYEAIHKQRGVQALR